MLRFVCFIFMFVCFIFMFVLFLFHYALFFFSLIDYVLCLYVCFFFLFMLVYNCGAPPGEIFLKSNRISPTAFISKIE